MGLWSGLFQGRFVHIRHGSIGASGHLVCSLAYAAHHLAAAVAGAGEFIQGFPPGRLVTALLVAANWLTFISAVSQGEIVASSLGYFIIPLFSVLLGVLFFAERLRPLQMVAIVLAICGVANQVITLGELPIIALTLAVTFGLYGLIRKKIAVDPLLGLSVETLLLSLFALAYLFWLDGQGELGFGSISIGMDLLLMLGGVVTTLPLVCFAAAANRLSLTTIGILHYLAPSITFLLAIYLYNEPFSRYQLITFGFIWMALAVFSWEGWLNQRKAVPAFQGV